MSLKKLFSFCIILFSIIPLYSHGKNDVEEISTDNMNSWQEAFDLEAKTAKKAKKYNIMITAKDFGGNEYVEGPYNIWVDPESDRPVGGITNPYPNMRVAGNLNIVGTCVDDDGVSRVELILDEGKETEAHVVANGKEFWSYYLDTNDLEEGNHTVKVIGYDINETPIASKPVTVTWQLDRKQPVTEVLNLGMGQLVSGGVTFKGTVTDGNGIKELSYSIDNGEHFSEVKLNKSKNTTRDFNIFVDTRKFEDGPAVIWFKAVDNAGSTGAYAHLYYIDNTKPDVSIVYPEEPSVMNGKFSVAGYAKDNVGLEHLEWSFGDQSGEIELVPGNPYWVVSVNTIGATKEKSRRFSVTARDRAGNVVSVGRAITLNQEEDKPLITISEPADGALVTVEDGRIFARGFATDDDGVKAVRVQLDSNEPVVQETNGTFCVDFGEIAALSAGNHKITAVAIDDNDVEGNPVSVSIGFKGLAPGFENPVVTTNRNPVPFENGMTIHPEAGSVFSVRVTAPAGLSRVETKYTNGDYVIENSSGELKSPASYDVNLPIPVEFPRGLGTFRISATDTMNRTSEYVAVIYVTNTSVLKSEELRVVFDDSTVEEDGSVINNREFPATGYFIGANAVSAELVPATPFATVLLRGNQIKLVPGDAIGSSRPVVVRVKTADGKTVDSRPLVFKNDSVLPQITLNGGYDTQALVGYGELELSGTVTCETGVGKLLYRMIDIPVEKKNGVVAKLGSASVPSELQSLAVGSDGSFSLKINAGILPEGFHIVEFIAESAGGNKAAAAAAVSNIEELPEGGAMKLPLFTWVDSFDVYAAAVFQGELDRNFQAYSRSEMTEGSNPLEFLVATDSGASASSRYTALRQPTLSANFALVGQEPYYSGMELVVPYNTAAQEKLAVYIDTGASVSSVSYEITGEPVPGGSQSQTGSVKPVKQPDSSRWIAEIPLANLPARMNRINVTVRAGSLEKVISGSVGIVRPALPETTNDEERKIFEIPDENTLYDAEDQSWVLSSGSKFYYYVNTPCQFSASLEPAVDGLSISQEGKLVTLSAQRDGTYRNVRIRISEAADSEGRLGDEYRSQPLTFLSDSEAPEIALQTPELNAWVDRYLSLSGTVADAIGIKSVEYSLNNGETWQELNVRANSNRTGITFSETIDVSYIEDGLVRLDVRATDVAGHVSRYTTACYKDVTPPEVTVIEPLADDVVNGQNLLVFRVKDNGRLAKSEYVMARTSSHAEIRRQLPLDHLVSTFVGTEEQPISEMMSFVFSDAAGNTTPVEYWSFIIDNISDLPRAEIYVPDENQVITRDFMISGILYDDDGKCTAYYKIDDGPYKQIATKEVYKSNDGSAEYELATSFEISVPLETMKDNEHTVTIYAVDVNGVKGEEIVRTFRVSLEEPKGAVESPTIDTSVKGVVSIVGRASDRNGIAKVEVSLDNGNSYNDAEGRENWIYTVDTRAIPGGTQVVFYRITDNYGISGLYSSLINIDNEAPHVALELPLDDSTTTGDLFFSGSAFDNVDVYKMYVTVRDLNGREDPEVYNLKLDRIISQTVDLSDLRDGFYNVELTGEDKAGNATNISRNIHLEKSQIPAAVDVLYPMNGEHKNGKFNIYGQASTVVEGGIEKLRLYVDGILLKETSLTDTGFFKFEISPASELHTGEYDENGREIVKITSDMTDGTHRYRVDAVLANGRQVPSSEQTVVYNALGPWITLDNFDYGDFATNRPYLRGTAGYSKSPDEVVFARSKDATKEEKAAIDAKRVARIEISFDNGKTFTQLSKNEKWMYRIENQDLAEGYHFILVRAVMENGEIAVERTLVQIDNTKPTVRLISPDNGGRYNQVLDVSGLSNDTVGLEDVKISLRKGDKASYEVPSFIQGLYLDFHFWGATLFDIGAGLTFFDDNVKLQVQWGQFTQAQRDSISNTLGLDLTEMRYGGNNIWGAKLLANIAALPFSYFFGHDFDWLSANFAVGAQFSHFNITASGQGQFLSAILAQLEFPKVSLANVKMFSTFSFYVEGSMWFIPTDVSGVSNRPVFQWAIGARTNVF